jgi:Flp pilus assembly protein TadG
MKALRDTLASDSGQALIETALCMPVLALFLAGAIDLGRFAQFDMTLASAAHAGAQYGSQNTTTAASISGMESAATADSSTVTATATSYYKCADGSQPSASPSLTMAGTASTTCSANHLLLYVSVTTTATFTPLFLFFMRGNGPYSHTTFMQVVS